jgi:hypothetical protein
MGAQYRSRSGQRLSGGRIGPARGTAGMGAAGAERPDRNRGSIANRQTPMIVWNNVTMV